MKLGLVPMHFWLPPAHGAAPVPASAVLSGAMIKAGLFGMIATLPFGLASFPDLGPLVMTVGLVTIFTALLLGVQQESPKAVLGFSSVSQMGILALGLGAGLLVPEAWTAILPALLFLAAHHALAKGALFLGVGAFAAQAPGAGRWLALAALAVSALVLAGLPATSGALGKEAMKTALGAASAVWLPWLTVALTLSGAATTLLMARHLFLLARKAPPVPSGLAPDAVALPFLGLGLVSMMLPAFWPWLAGPMAVPRVEAAAWWPIALGAAVAIAAAVHAHAQRIGPEVFAARLAAPLRDAGARLRRARSGAPARAAPALSSGPAPDCHDGHRLEGGAVGHPLADRAGDGASACFGTARQRASRASRHLGCRNRRKPLKPGKAGEDAPREQFHP